MRISNLIYQPTAHCSHSCQQCYVKQWEEKNRTNSNKEVEVEVAEDVADLLTNKTVEIDNFILSLNTSPRNEEPCIILQGTLPLLSNTKITLAVRDEYELLQDGVFELTCDADLIAISKIAHHNDATKILEKAYKQGKSIIFNTIQELGNIPEFINLTHLILRKPALGDEYMPAPLNTYKVMLKTIRQRNIKYCEDRCIIEARRYLKTGQPCSACSDIIHIWPDGSVSGCPYDSNMVCAARPDTYISLSDRIKAVQEEIIHPIKYCTLPDYLKENNYA